ncbi:MAG: hypothetical protein KAR19_12015 [Bacteroidales bacterium]|nr:hypothetical protein [Bacteroidales bacterium]
MKRIITLIAVMAMAVLSLMAQEPAEEPQEVQEAQEPAEEPQEVQEAQQPEGKQRRKPGEVQTLFDSNRGSGGYGAFTIGYTQIDGRDAFLMGGRGAWVIGHGFGLGLGGYGFVNDPVYDAVDDLNYSLMGGYGGLVMEPIIMGWLPVHLSFPILIGAGGVANTSYSANWNDPYEHHPGSFEGATAFFVAEGGIELEFNLVRFFRLALYSSYRYTSDIIMPNTSMDTPVDALKGWSYGITFKFGSF